MITIFYGKVKCRCCSNGPHGYGRPLKSAEAETDVTLRTAWTGRWGTSPVGEMANVVTEEQYEFLKTSKIFQHRVETGTYRIEVRP